MTRVSKRCGNLNKALEYLSKEIDRLQDSIALAEWREEVARAIDEDEDLTPEQWAYMEEVQSRHFLKDIVWAIRYEVSIMRNKHPERELQELIDLYNRICGGRWSGTSHCYYREKESGQWICYSARPGNSIDTIFVPGKGMSLKMAIDAQYRNWREIGLWRARGRKEAKPYHSPRLNVRLVGGEIVWSLSEGCPKRGQQNHYVPAMKEMNGKQAHNFVRDYLRFVCESLKEQQSNKKMESEMCFKSVIDGEFVTEAQMHKYKCHKEVHATPMKRGAYNELRGWELPENENPDDNGYLVVYNRGTDDEYVSWSPKHIFENGYSKISQ